MQAEILLKLRIVIQIFEFIEVVSVTLCSTLEGDSSLFSAVPAYLEDGTALLKQQGASEEFLVACNPLQVTKPCMLVKSLPHHSGRTSEMNTAGRIS